MSLLADSLPKGDFGTDFELRIFNSNEEVQVECTRSLYPIELLQVLTNFLALIPETKRKIACDIALTSARGRGSRLIDSTN